MKTLPLAHVKANLSRLVDQVIETDEEVVITRNGRPAAILVSPDEYEGWKETQAIRSDRELVAEIRRGLRMLERGAKIYRAWRNSSPNATAVAPWNPTASGCRVESRSMSEACIPELKRKVRVGLDLIRTDPEVGKELRDELAGLAEGLRVGRFRIVYRVAARRLINLVAIGPRRTIYQETLRLLRRP